MKICFIWPRGFDHEYSLPLPFAYLISNLDTSRHEVSVIDCVLDNLDARSPQLKRLLLDQKPQVVGFSCFTPQYHEVISLSRLVKTINPTTHTVLGGIHATAVPEQVLKEDSIDFVMRGEVELVFPKFIEELENDTPDLSIISGLCYRKEGPSPAHISDIVMVQDLDRVRFPDYRAIQLERYLEVGYRFDARVKRNAPIRATRGCPYQCAFCATPRLSGRKLRRHSIKYLLAWTKYLYDDLNIRWINLIDDNFTFDTEYAAEFCRRVIALKLKGLCLGTPNGIRIEHGNSELWRLMKEAGWNSLIVAPESGSLRVLRLMKKNTKIEKIPGIVKDIKATGLQVKAFFMLGYPGENVADIQKTSKFIKEC
ncbi:MAG: B12-binding domain-containing radical SAM protein, partial [Anaerolineales bacterium]|nr:B12-binding domain-containing radical SAM protein [Anaerolineales bacterium]